MAVVDTSVLLAALLDEDHSARATAALKRHDGNLHAPDVIRLEIANALINAVRRKRLDAGQAEAVMGLSASIPLRLHPTAPLVPRAWRLSMELARRPYDGVFIALAEVRRETLLTLDQALVAGVAGTPVAAHVEFVG
jgi:predicted nucleic acid-binding protein